MTDEDSDDRDWLLGRPFARTVVDAAGPDAPPAGFEARLLDALRTAPAREDAAGADVGVVAAADAAPPDIVISPAKQSTSAPSKKASRTASARLIFASTAAIAGALALALWTLRKPSSDVEKRALPERTAEAPVVVASAEPREAKLCNPAVAADPAFTSIDDFEDGNARMLVRGGRFGTWNYVVVDVPGDPVVEPLRPQRVDPDSGDGYALHALAAGRHDWRAVWAAFGPPCYDASSFVGLRFRGRGPARLTLEIRTVDDVEQAKGGTCKADCYHPHGKLIPLGSTFERKDVLFTALTQPADTPESARRPFDPRRLSALALVVDPRDRSFEFWIDDVEWIRQ